MRIARDMVIVGVPAFEVRRLFREGDRLTAELVKTVLEVPERRACEILAALAREGFLKEQEPKSRAQVWELTTQGRALRIAKAGTPIKRSTADRLVAEFLQRVAKVNATRAYAYRVTQVVAFGSYLTDRPDLGDIDIGMTLTPKWPDEGSYEELTRPRIRAAIAAGRHFGTYSDELGWPQREIELFLKNRSRALSLTYVQWIPPEAETKVLYDWAKEDSSRAVTSRTETS